VRRVDEAVGDLPRAGAALREDGPRLVVQAWLGSRLLLALVLVWTLWSTGTTWQSAAGSWDVAHFLRIARDGYAAENEVAFFPGLPLLLRAAGALGLDMTGAGILASVIGSAFAGWALWRLGGPRRGVVAAALWLFAPTAVFTVVPYTESIFAAFAFWAWLRARKGRWAWAALLAAGACSVRVSGVFLLVALGVLALTGSYDGDRRWSRRLVAVAWLLVPAAVPVAYATYLRLTTGSWLAWYSAQADGWGRRLTWPWDTFAHTLRAIVPGAYADHPGWAWVFRGEVVSVVVGLLVTVACLVLRQWAEATWVGIQVVAFATSYWYMSVNRAVLLWFPLWLLLGSFATRPGRTRRARVLVVALWGVVSALLLIWWAARFFSGQWAS
jgi:hypothetical protein